MSNLQKSSWDELEPLEKAAFLLRLEKSKTFVKLDNYSDAEKELYNALKIALQMAERAEKETNKSLFIEAINSFKRLLMLFEKHRFMKEAWAETHVVIAICYHHIHLGIEAKSAFKKAIELEPTNQKIQDIGMHYGWLDTHSQ